MCRTIDHIGIFLLIAGTATPPAVVLLRGRLQLASLFLAWTLAACGIALQLSWSGVPPWLYTLIYVGMGWGVFVGYFEVAHLLPAGAMRPVWLGGVFYTVGAMINLSEWPPLAPGIFGSHELWHLFAMAGSLCHFWFMLCWVAPFDRRQAMRARPSVAPAPPCAVSPVQMGAPTS
jgi:hemolysin III